MREPLKTELGTIKIHKNVIASLSSIATLEVEGVARIGGDIKSSISELLGRKVPLSIKVDIDSQNEVKIEIPVVVKYGYNIPEVAAKIQENVREAIEKMTELILKDIDIQITGIEKKEEK